VFLVLTHVAVGWSGGWGRPAFKFYTCADTGQRIVWICVQKYKNEFYVIFYTSALSAARLMEDPAVNQEAGYKVGGLSQFSVLATACLQASVQCSQRDALFI
jgi:hypothetical protein